VHACAALAIVLVICSICYAPWAKAAEAFAATATGAITGRIVMMPGFPASGGGELLATTGGCLFG
jgi:hypothetical protein